MCNKKNDILYKYTPNKIKKKVLKIDIKWWSYAGSNRGPPACKAGALPAEL